jgi:hypothetical protein
MTFSFSKTNTDSLPPILSLPLLSFCKKCGAIYDRFWFAPVGIPASQLPIVFLAISLQKVIFSLLLYVVGEDAHNGVCSVIITFFIYAKM